MIQAITIMQGRRKIHKAGWALGPWIMIYQKTNTVLDQIAENPEQSESDDDFDDLDTVINFSALTRDQQYDLNSIGRSYFLGREDFIKYLQHEAD